MPLLKACVHTIWWGHTWPGHRQGHCWPVPDKGMPQEGSDMLTSLSDSVLAGLTAGTMEPDAGASNLDMSYTRPCLVPPSSALWLLHWLPSTPDTTPASQAYRASHKQCSPIYQQYFVLLRMEKELPASLGTEVLPCITKWLIIAVNKCFPFFNI